MSDVGFQILEDRNDWSDEVMPVAPPRRRQNGGIDRTEPRDQGGNEDGGERDPENTRDMLWLYLQNQIAAQKEGNARITAAIDRQTETLEALKTVQDEQDLRHQKTLTTAADKLGVAQIEAARVVAEARRYEAKVAGALGALLILGLLATTGLKVTGKLFDQELSAEPTAGAR